MTHQFQFSYVGTMLGEDTCLTLNHAGVKLSYQSHERENIPLLLDDDERKFQPHAS